MFFIEFPKKTPQILIIFIFTILIPPIHCIVEGEDALFDEVWVLGGELVEIVAGYDTEK